MAWKKGQSGNPGGRPRAEIHVRDLAREHTAEALKVMVEVMRDKKAPATARLGAAQGLIDRAWGKPAQIIAGDAEGDPIRVDAELSDRDLARRIAMILGQAGKG